MPSVPDFPYPPLDCPAVLDLRRLVQEFNSCVRAVDAFEKEHGSNCTCELCDAIECVAYREIFAALKIASESCTTASA